MTGALTKQVQAKLGVRADGGFGPGTEAAVRAFQRRHNLVPDGIVGTENLGCFGYGLIPLDNVIRTCKESKLFIADYHKNMGIE
jgi:peptidoglycan hydrolase-like protein with peptidoglycan-binding domain